MSHTEQMREWRIDYDNDTGSDDGSFWEWWTLTNGVRSFKCDSEADAQWLQAALAAPAAEPQATPIPCAVHVAGRTFEAGTPFCDVIEHVESTRLRGGVPDDCDVRKIMLDIVPGDGSGFEVFAKNVKQVEDKLTELAVRLEEAESKLTAAPQAPALDADPLQGAANWIVSATSYDRATHIAEIQQRLLIGYNRASRLYDAAMSAQGGGK